VTYFLPVVLLVTVNSTPPKATFGCPDTISFVPNFKPFKEPLMTVSVTVLLTTISCVLSSMIIGITVEFRLYPLGAVFSCNSYSPKGIPSTRAFTPSKVIVLNTSPPFLRNS